VAEDVLDEDGWDATDEVRVSIPAWISITVTGTTTPAELRAILEPLIEDAIDTGWDRYVPRSAAQGLPPGCDGTVIFPHLDAIGKIEIEDVSPPRGSGR